MDLRAKHCEASHDTASFAARPAAILSKTSTANLLSTHGKVAGFLDAALHDVRPGSHHLKEHSTRT
jgi:hypothetical protein